MAPLSTETNPQAPSRLSIFRNWLTWCGLIIVLGSLFAFLFLFTIDAFAKISNPYIGILTYFVAPGFTVLGLLMATVGALFRRRQLLRSTPMSPVLTIDFSRPRDRKIMGIFLGSSAAFLLITALGTYHTYH